MRQVLLLSLGEFVVNVVISGIIAVALQRWLKLSSYEEILAGLILFLCLLVIQIRYQLAQVAQALEKRSDERGILLETRDGVKQLVSVQDVAEDLGPKLRKIAHGIRILSARYSSADVFVRWYFSKVDSLQHHLQHTLDTESFDFDLSRLQERNCYLDGLQGRETDYGLALAHCKDFMAFATAEGAASARDLDQRFTRGEITSIRRLFVYETRSELEVREISILLCLHEQSSYEYRVISKKDLDHVYQAFGDKSLVKDFGVWGERFVWETPPHNVISQLGEICRKKARIEKYRRLYKELWEVTSPYRVTNQEIVELCKGHGIGSFRELIASANA